MIYIPIGFPKGSKIAYDFNRLQIVVISKLHKEWESNVQRLRRWRCFLAGLGFEFWPDSHFSWLSCPTLAYVTYQDIRAVGNFKEQTVIAVKAPPQTRLEVPDRTEVRGEIFGGEQGWDPAREGSRQLCRLCPRHCLAPCFPGPFWWPWQYWWPSSLSRNGRSWKGQPRLSSGLRKSLFLVSSAFHQLWVPAHMHTRAHVWRCQYSWKSLHADCAFPS